MGAVAEEILELGRDRCRGDACEGAAFDVVLDDFDSLGRNVTCDDSGGGLLCPIGVRSDIFCDEVPGSFFKGGLVFKGKVSANSRNEFVCNVGGFEAEGAAAGHEVQ